MSPEKAKEEKITKEKKIAKEKPVKAKAPKKKTEEKIEAPKIEEKQIKKEKPKIAKTEKKKIPKEEKLAIFSPKIEKVTINIGVGEAGERLKKAETVLQNISGQKPVETLSKTTNKDWGLRKDMPIGCKVTLRGETAKKFLIEALGTRENKMADYSFDDEGNLSFGVPDHTMFKSQKYDPNIGIFGMDICITMKKPGYRIKHRKISTRSIPHRHRVKKDETMKFFRDNFKLEVIE